MQDQSIKEQIIEHIKDDTIYDFIASNYYLMSDAELVRVLLEYIYIFYKATKMIQEISSGRANELTSELIENINEYLD